jgi:hypothetical protein
MSFVIMNTNEEVLSVDRDSKVGTSGAVSLDVGS